MTPLSMIFKRHCEIYKSHHLFDSTKTTDAEALNQVMAVATGQVDPYNDIKRYADYWSVSEQVAAMAIRFKQPSKETHGVIVEIQKCIAILGNGYIHHNEHVIKSLQQFPGLFNEKILSLSGSDMKFYSHRACVDYVNVSRLMQCLGKDIDLKYWNIAGSHTDILENCKANGIAFKTVLSALLSEISEGENPEHLKGLMEVSYLSNLFKVGNPLELLLISYEVTLKSHRDNPFLHHLFPSTIVKALAEAKLLDNPEDWSSSNLLGGRLKYLLWVLRFRQWYADETVVTTEDGLRIVINHHELVSHAINNLQMLPKELNYKQHPKGVLKDVLMFVVETKANDLRSKIKNATKYHLPETVKSRLPDHWHFVDNEYSQILEGQTMNHCCGGRHYLEARSSGKSIFFHVDTNEPHGLTVELRKVEYDHYHPHLDTVASTMMRIRYPDIEAPTPCKPDIGLSRLRADLESALNWPAKNTNLFVGSGIKFNVYKLGQVKGRRNRNPTADELKEVRAGLFRISDLKAIGEAAGITSTVSVIDVDTMEVIDRGLSLTTENVGEILYTAEMKGHYIVECKNVQEKLEYFCMKRMAETPVVVAKTPEFDITLNGIDENPMVRLFREAREPIDFSLARMAVDLRADHAVLRTTPAEAFLTPEESDARTDSVYSSTLSVFRNRYDYSYFAYIKAFRENMNAPIFRHHGEISNIAREREVCNWETNHRNPNVFSNVISLKNTNYIWLPIEPEEATC